MERRPLKVLHIINNLDREGAQVVVYNLIISSTNENIEYVVIPRMAGGRIQLALQQRGVNVRVPGRYFRAHEFRQSVAYIEKIISEEDIDLIHANMADAAFLGWLAARRSRLPLVITHHGEDIFPRCGRLCRGFHAALLYFAARYAHYNVAVSPAVASTLYRKLGLANDKVRIIANGVPLPPAGMLERRPESTNKRFTIVTVGRLVDIKGHAQLLAAAEILRGRIPDFSICVVGDGPLRADLERQVQAMRLAAHFEFVGSVDDVSPYLLGADLFVSTSHIEGMPISVLEAMAWGVPVVASDIPGNRTIVTHEETGLLYPLNDTKALAEVVMLVKQSPDLTTERMQRARRLVEQHYNAASVSIVYEKMYREIVGRDER